MTNKHSPAPPSVLVLMPMLPGYEAIRGTVAATIVRAGLELVWLDELLQDWEWLEWLNESVRRCTMVLADPSKHNAFVMYELGIARPKALPTVVILDQEDSQLSGSLDGSPFLLYSRSNLERFSGKLSSELSELARVAVSPRDRPVDRQQCYRDAVRLLERFQHETGKGVEAVSESAFEARLQHAGAHGTFVAALLGTRIGDVTLLAALVRSSRMVETMAAIRAWSDTRWHS